MKYKITLISLLLSLPLLPSLLIGRETLNQAIASNQILLATPLALEFLSFYFLYAFIKNRNSEHNAEEKKALMILATGIFLIIGIPVLIAGLLGDMDKRIVVTFITSFVYAFINLAVNTKRIIASSEKIEGYFLNRYMLPGAISLLLTIALALLFPITINAVVAYYILKNFTLMQR